MREQAEVGNSFALGHVGLGMGNASHVGFPQAKTATPEKGFLPRREMPTIAKGVPCPYSLFRLAITPRNPWALMDMGAIPRARRDEPDEIRQFQDIGRPRILRHC